jgi:hypothetical protein
MAAGLGRMDVGEVMLSNKSVNTDAQGRPRLRRSNSLCAGYLQR